MSTFGLFQLDGRGWQRPSVAEALFGDHFGPSTDKSPLLFLDIGGGAGVLSLAAASRGLTVRPLLTPFAHPEVDRRAPASCLALASLAPHCLLC